MTDHEQDRFEAELRRMSPATPPESMMVRLLAAKRPALPRATESARDDSSIPSLVWLLRWLIPAAAVVIVSVTLWRGGIPSSNRSSGPAASSEEIATAGSPALKADDVQIGQELVSSFDAVARLPGGEPVRFRLQQWMDQVVLSDSTQGLTVESRTPRFEVVPVGFETY